MNRKFSSIEQAVEVIGQGGVVIVLDSEDRENEGDFIAAAEAVTPQMIHFMISMGRGQLCLPLLPEAAARLQLTLMAANPNDPSVPRFTVPVDHVACKTGISPWERAYTIQRIVDRTSRAEDFLRPGHVFPLIAENEGVLKRPGHTESAVELARLAGLTPAGVLCEVCSRDGLHMADRDELLELGAEHNLPVIAIDALIEYVRGERRTTPRQAEAQIVELDPRRIAAPAAESASSLGLCTP